MTKLGLHLLCWTLVACGSSGSQSPAAGSGTNTAAPAQPAAPAAPAAPPEPAALQASADPDALDLSKLDALSEVDLATLRLEISFMGPPVGPGTTQVTYQIDAEHFGKRAAGAPEVARKTAGSFREIVNALGRHGIAARPEKSDPGCEGGSTYELAASAAKKSTRLRAYDCGGEVTGTLGGDIAALIEDLEWLLPDAQRTLPRPAK